MKFNQALIRGTLIQRYKRFLADVCLDSGEKVTAHTANSGSMKGLISPGNPVFLTFHDRPERKLKYSWEIVQVGPTFVGINTSLPNLLVEEGIRSERLQELRGYRDLRREVKYGENSRVDLLLSNGDRERCYVEVKNVTLMEEGRALFPDAVSERGRKHLGELVRMVREGHRAVLFYVVQRGDAHTVYPAEAIDPEYAKALRLAVKAGVEVVAYQAKVGLDEIVLTSPLKVETSF